MVTDEAEDTTTTGRTRRMIEGTVFVAVWIALGYLLPVDTNLYILLGIPLTAAFQLVVRRRPLRELWVRDPDRRFRLDRAGVALAVLLAVTPVVALVDAAGAGAWSGVLWAAAAVVATVPAAWAFRRTRLVVTVREALPTVLAGAVLLTVIGVLPLLVTGRPFDPVAAAGSGLYSALLYLPAVFLLEEVAFRGALDAHVQHPGERRGAGTALFVSVVWGLWHLPITPGPLWATALQVVVVSVVLGIPLSYAWRRTGTLAAPGLAHAVYDGMRNAVLS